MSADNRLCFMEWGGCRWHVWHGTCSADYYEPPFESPSLRSFNTEREAREYLDAEEERMYKNCDILEGGVTFIGPHEQETALEFTIASLTKRLENLKIEGNQFPQWITNRDPT